MSFAFTIIIEVIIAILLELLLFVLWIFTETVLVSYFKAPKTIDTDFFKEKSSNGIPYIEDRGIPYKGNIDSKTNQKVILNSGYKFSINSNLCSPNGILGGAINVDLPHCFNKVNSELRDYQGDVWYEKTFDYSRVEGKPIVRLTFDGSFLNTNVWLDGKHIGENSEGYLPFSFDISSLEAGAHKLVIKVNNVTSTETLPISLFPGHKVGWHHYSGIHKDVYIEYLPAVTAFKMTAIPIEINGNWSVNANVLLSRNIATTNETVDCDLKIVSSDNKTITDNKVKVHFVKGEKVSGTSILIDVLNPILWAEGNPNLYKLTLKSVYEESSVNFGFRKITWGDGKIRMNGNQIFLKGVCRHEDNGLNGLATDKEIINNELNLIAKANGNFVRLAHYPHSKVTLDITDKLGMYAWDEVPFYQAGLAIAHDTFGKGSGEVSMKGFSIQSLIRNFRKTSLARNKKLLTLAAQSLIKMVERDINHPSIITWSIGNEVWSVNKATGKALGWLRDTVKRYDSSRAVNYAAMCMPVITKHFEASFKYMDWACINEYYGWYYGKVSDVKALAESISKKYPNKPLVITETGSDTMYGLRDNSYPPVNKHSEDYQKYYFEETWKNLSLAPTFSGFTVWVFKDFPCPEYNEKNPVPYYNMKGLFDKDMHEKLSYKTISNLYSTKK